LVPNSTGAALNGHSAVCSCSVWQRMHCTALVPRKLQDLVSYGLLAQH
jgi:hypothetical protein